MDSMRDIKLAGKTVLTSAAVMAALPAAALAAGSGEPYYGDLGQAIAAVTIFVILFLILRKWAWGPVVSTVRRREEGMAEALKTAESQQTEAAELLEEYRARLASAEADAANVVAKSRKQAALRGEEILTAARAEARKNIAKGNEDIERARREALQELRIDTARLATDVAEQVIDRELTEDDQRRLMKQAMAEIESQVMRQGERT